VISSSETYGGSKGPPDSPGLEEAGERHTGEPDINQLP
jgi:hypothetical protein